MHIRMLKPLKARKNKREVKSRHLESTNYDVMIDNHTLNSGVIIASPNSDAILRNVELNKAIARTRYAQKHSFVSKIGSFKSLLRVCSRTFTFIALLLAIVISVSGGLFNIRLPERKSTVGTSCELLIAISWRDSLFLSILRESSANILGSNEGLCLCMMAETSWNDSKQLIRRRGVLHNTR